VAAALEVGLDIGTEAQRKEILLDEHVHLEVRAILVPGRLGLVAVAVAQPFGPQDGSSPTERPAAEERTVVTPGGIAQRRLLAPHMARETLIVPLRSDAEPTAKMWADAYASESNWLSEDLATAGLPTLADFWA
jgi:hypothetical protein